MSQRKRVAKTPTGRTAARTRPAANRTRSARRSARAADTLGLGKDREGFMQLLMDIVPHYVFARDLEGRLLFVNRHMAEMKGFASPAAMLEADAESTGPGCSEQDLQVIHSGRPSFVAEERIDDWTGKTRIVQTSRIPFKLPGRNERAVLGVSIDITEQKEAEMALIESETLHRSILGAARDAIITVDRHGVIVGANQAVKRLFGYRINEIEGKNVSLFLPAIHDSKSGRPAAPNDDMERPFTEKQGEIVARRKDGSTFPAELSINAVGHLDLHTAIVRDISERKRAEKALRYEHEFRRKVIETAQTIILILDKEGRVVQYNKYFEHLSGWPIEETEGSDWFETFLPSRDRDRIRNLFGRAISGVHTRGNVNPIVTKDGQERAIEWFDSPLTDESGAIVGLLCTGIDITERQLLEQEVINAAEDERLRTAQELHDGLGSLLTGVDYRARALANQCMAEGSEWAKEVETISQLVREAISQVKAISKGLHPVSSDPAGLMNALRLLILQTHSAPGIRCQFRCHKPVLIKDPTAANHLFRIAQEALNNAVKYSGGGGITVSLGTKNHDLVLKVLDNGAGFDPDDVAADGLGLHVMHYRARALRGSLLIRRRKKRGMEVRCTVSADLLAEDAT